MLSVYCFQILTDVSCSGLSKCMFITLLGAFCGFLLLSVLPYWFYANTHPFWVVKGASIFLYAPADFLSVRKKSAWVFWHFWKQHKALVFFSCILEWLLLPSPSELEAFSEHLVCSCSFFFFFLDHFSWVFLVTRVNLLFTDSVCVLSSRSKCGERDELSPKRIKIEVQYWDSFILTYLC